MSSRSRRVKPEVWKAGDVAWVQYKAGPARGTLDKRLGETTWNVSFDDGGEKVGFALGHLRKAGVVSRDLRTADGRTELIKLASRLIVEESLEAQAGVCC